MAEILMLGTGAAFTDGTREPTMLALRGRYSTIVIDCGANAIRQLQQLNVPLDSIERLVLTHSHPDHTSGFGLLVEMIWLSGRRRPLPVHGPASTIDLARRLWTQWDARDWKGVPELEWHTVPLEVGAPVSMGADFELTAAPGVHLVPVIGIRARDLYGGGVLTFSSDGEPSSGIRTLAQGSDVLVHEATGAFAGHSTAEGAAELAHAAGVRRLILVHLSSRTNDLEVQRLAAQRILGHPVLIGRDLDRYEF